MTKLRHIRRLVVGAAIPPGGFFVYEFDIVDAPGM
jgi:hypothetical protein